MTYHLTTPIRPEDIRELQVGDVLYISGVICTGRDDVHRRIVDESMESPYDFRDGVNFHAGPIVRKNADGYEMVAVGPTSSIRMEAWEAGFLEKTGARILIGKGGMGEKTTRACKDFQAIHCVAPGGCAVYLAQHIEKILACHWQELGMPECEWVLQVRDFGPLVVTIDSHGRNLYTESKALYASRREGCEAPIRELVQDYMVVE